MSKLPPRTIHNLPDLFEYRCRQQPDELAYALIRDSLEIEHQLTYAQLEETVRSLAGHLAHVARPGTRALLLSPQGLDAACAFWACVCAGLVPIPAPAPDPVRWKHGLPRLRAIIEDAQVSLALTTSSITALSSEFSIAKEVGSIRWMATDQPYDSVDSVELPQLPSTTLAYLQYTSGSTATPRGVMISHENVISHCRALSLVGEVSNRSRSLCWLPYFHDYGLLHGIIAPFYTGNPTYLMSPVTFLRRPLRWLEAVARFGITHSGGPNFSYDACLRAARQQPDWQADLSSWKVASCGAEPIHTDTVKRFIETFGPRGFKSTSFAPAYGLAEATLLVTMKRSRVEPTFLTVETEALASSIVKVSDVVSENGARTLVGCGEPLEETHVRIVNPVTRAECPSDVVGEVWLAGAGIGAGYWGKPEETEAIFKASIAGSEEGPYLRTGDLGFLHGGELFLTGRIKDLIIVRGRNYYPHDLEWTVEHAHPGLRRGSGAAFSIEGKTGELVVLVHEIDRQLSESDLPDVMNCIRRALADEYGLELHTVVLIKSGTIPRTSSGKIQRGVCKAAFELGQLAIVASSTLDPDPQHDAEGSPSETPHTIVEKKLADIWQEVLGGDPPDRHANFFALGGHSLLATQLVSRTRDIFEVNISLQTLFERPTIAAMAEEVTRLRQREQKASLMPPITPVPRDQPLPLSYSQQRMWLMYQLAPESTAYNMPFASRQMGRLNKSALRSAIDAIYSRHEAFRTTFMMKGEGPVQMIHPFRPPHLVEVDLQHLPRGQRQQQAAQLVEQEANQRFDLEKGPLARFLLIGIEPEDHVLVLTMHHIIGDQWSFGVIGHEFAYFYNAFCWGGVPSEKPIPLQYADYAVWQRRCLTDDWLSTQSDYWRKKLAGLSKLSLPTDHPRPMVQTFNGSHRMLELPTSLIEGLKQFSAQHNATVFMTLLACFQILLSRYSSQTDVAVGSPIANRTQSAVESIIGSFVNTLVLRTDLSGDPTFIELLARVRETALEAYTHQDFPFDKLVEMMHSSRDQSSAPLVQVLFNVPNAPIREINVQGLSWVPFEVETQAAQFDLSLTVETEFSRKAYLTFNTDLFEPRTAERMLGQYQILLQYALANPDSKLSELPTVTSAERQQMLEDWNHTQRDYPQSECFPQLFEAQVERTPDAVAVSMGPKTLPYGQLNARANQLARYLQTLGAKPGTTVGIGLDRSLEMVIALLTVLKTGAAYVPLDPEFPRDRLRFMAQDASVAVVLTTTDLADRFDAQVCRILCLDREKERIAQEADHNLGPIATPQDLAYILYTSGSTGQPKGVEIGHRALVNFLWSIRQEPGCSAQDVMLSVTTISFDIFGLELYVPLLAGARVEIAGRAVAMDGRQLRDLYESVQPTIMQATPATWRMLVEAGWQGSKNLTILCGGESLLPDLAASLLDRSIALWNMYGPTETTIWSTIEKVERTDREITIGRPIANTDVYILDQFLQPVPIGVSGELYIGGHGLARGYRGRPELTQDRFIAHPFSPEPLAKLYRTGDLARYRPDGRIVHLGRMDNQVKIRGFRIELGDIEAALSRHQAVRQVVVTAREDQQGIKQLVAYVVCQDGLVLSPADLRSFLRSQIPDYMVPSLFVFLTELPLTANNKIDRKALPSPFSLFSDELIRSGPRDPMEVQLTALWQQVLEVQKIGIHDNFFDLGGHSLKAAHFFFLLERVYGRHLPLATLFQAPTIAELAAVLSHEHWTPPWQSLVAIQPSGTAIPIFMVPGVGGNVLVFARLAKLLGPDQPCYGLQARGLDGKEAPFTSIPEMASHYIAEIRRVRSNGPYVILGACTGGLIAYEMAQQLLGQGEAVTLVVMDTWHPSSYRSHRYRWPTQLGLPLFVLWWAVGNIRVLFRLPIKNWIPFLQRKCQRLMSFGRTEAGSEQLLGAFQVEHVTRATLQAVARYNVCPYPGRLINIVASKRHVARTVTDTRHAWPDLGGSGSRTLEVPAINSGQLLVTPHVEDVAKHLQNVLVEDTHNEPRPLAA